MTQRPAARQREPVAVYGPSENSPLRVFGLKVPQLKRVGYFAGTRQEHFGAREDILTNEGKALGSANK